MYLVKIDAQNKQTLFNKFTASYKEAFTVEKYKRDRRILNAYTEKDKLILVTLSDLLKKANDSTHSVLALLSSDEALSDSAGIQLRPILTVLLKGMKDKNKFNNSLPLGVFIFGTQYHDEKYEKLSLKQADKETLWKMVQEHLKSDVVTQAAVLKEKQERDKQKKATETTEPTTPQLDQNPVDQTPAPQINPAPDIVQNQPPKRIQKKTKTPFGPHPIPFDEEEKDWYNEKKPVKQSLQPVAQPSIGVFQSIYNRVSSAFSWAYYNFLGFMARTLLDLFGSKE